MSPTTPIPPTPPRPRERLVIRGFAALSAVGFATSLGISIARAAHALVLADDTFTVFAVWALSIGCLGLGIAAFCGSDPRPTRALAKLNYGDPALDDVLCDKVRTPWRARRGIPTVCTATAAACWILAIPYSVQIALGVYRIPPVTQLFLLGWMLGAGLWSTVLAVSAPAERRRADAFALACDMHRAQREHRAEGEQRIAQAPLGDTGEIPRPPTRLRAVDSERDASRRLARYGDTG